MPVSRRAFLGLSAAAAVGVTHRPEERLDAEPQQCGDLPPSLAALSSRRAEASPIGSDERAARIARAQRLMGQRQLAALLLTGGTSLEYFTAVRWGLSERLFAVVLPAAGAPFVVCPAFEADRAREQLAVGPLGPDADLRTWEEDQSPSRLLADGLRQRGIAGATVGVEETVRHGFSDGLAQAAPGLTLVSGTPVSAGCRMVKDEHELALMQLANEVTLAAYHAAWQTIKEDMTQADVSRLISQAHDRLGFPGGASVQTGEWSALPHGSVAPQRIRPGTIVMIDGGCTVEGYASDITRTFVLGIPSDKVRRVFDIVHRAQSAALAAARPGVECQAVDAAARRVITDQGYGPGYTYFSHRVGHGIGMDGHEWPYLVGGNTLPLEPGMTFSDEPGIYLRGEFGMRLEDDMAITPDGARLLTPRSPSLEQPFGAA
jgi:Xaa-Pro dipeptidase